MSRGVNKAILLGNIGKDPASRQLPDGGTVASFSIAVNESWKDKNGQKVERVEWVNCVAFKRLAEIICQYGTKGQQVYVAGKLRTRNYEKDGQKHYATEVVVEEFQMLGGKRDRETSAANYSEHMDRKRASSEFQQPADFDDDIDF